MKPWELYGPGARDISRNPLWRRFYECLEEFHTHGMTENILREAQSNEYVAKFVAALPKECIEKFQERVLTEALLRAVENSEPVA